MNPGHELPAIASPSAEAASYKTQERVEHAARIRTQRHRRPKCDLPSMFENHLVEGALPLTGDIDAESPRAGRGRFLPAEEPGTLVIRMVVRVRIDRGRTGLQPEARRTRRPCDSCPDSKG